MRDMLSRLPRYEIFFRSLFLFRKLDFSLTTANFLRRAGKRNGLMLIRASQVSSLFFFLFLSFFPLVRCHNHHDQLLSDTQSKEIIFSLWTHKYKIVYEIIEGDFESVGAFWRIYGWNHWLIGWLLFYCLFTTF